MEGKKSPDSSPTDIENIDLIDPASASEIDFGEGLTMESIDAIIANIEINTVLPNLDIDLDLKSETDNSTSLENICDLTYSGSSAPVTRSSPYSLNISQKVDESKEQWPSQKLLSKLNSSSSLPDITQIQKELINLKIISPLLDFDPLFPIGPSTSKTASKKMFASRMENYRSQGAIPKSINKEFKPKVESSIGDLNIPARPIPQMLPRLPGTMDLLKEYNYSCNFIWKKIKKTKKSKKDKKQKYRPIEFDMEMMSIEDDKGPSQSSSSGPSTEHTDDDDGLIFKIDDVKK